MSRPARRGPRAGKAKVRERRHRAGLDRQGEPKVKRAQLGAPLTSDLRKHYRSDGTVKLSYPEHIAKEVAAVATADPDRPDLNAYACPLGSHWHVGRKR